MNYTLIKSILQGKWAIDPQFALNSLPLIQDFLSGRVNIESKDDESFSPSFVNPSKRKSYSIADAEKGSVAVIPIRGSLMKYSQDCGPVGMATIGDYIEQADENTNIEGIVLLIDSPGGTVDGTEALASIIEKTKKPVVAYVDGLMASAALWIGSAANEVFASTDTDEIGSVGVLLSFADVQPMWEKEGIKFHTIISSLSPDKIKIWDDLRSGKYEDYKNNVLDPLAEKFQATIRRNRSTVKDEHLTGKVFFAKDVMGVFVDQIGTLEEAINRVHELSQANKKSNSTQFAETMKHKNTLKALNLETIEIVDGSVSLSVDELDLIETALSAEPESVQADLDRIQQLETENATLTDEVSELTTQVENLQNAPGADTADTTPATDADDSADVMDGLSREDVSLYNLIKQG